MCSKVSNPAQASLFLKNTLDSQPFAETGDYGKAHFLAAGTVLMEIKFLDRPMLDKLIDHLASLFGVRYRKQPTQAEKDLTENLKQAAEKSNEDILWAAYYATPFYVYENAMAKLKSHDETISIFEDALSIRSSWPDSDPPEIQDFHKLSSLQMIKTGWRSTLFMVALTVPTGTGESGGVISDSDNLQEVDKK